jgi:hypothetical protein
MVVLAAVALLCTVDAGFDAQLNLSAMLGLFVIGEVFAWIVVPGTRAAM